MCARHTAFLYPWQASVLNATSEVFSIQLFSSLFVSWLITWNLVYSSWLRVFKSNKRLWNSSCFRVSLLCCVTMGKFLIPLWWCGLANGCHSSPLCLTGLYYDSNKIINWNAWQNAELCTNMRGGAVIVAAPGPAFFAGPGLCTSHDHSRVFDLRPDEIHTNHSSQVVHAHLVDSTVQLDFM